MSFLIRTSVLAALVFTAACLYEEKTWHGDAALELEQFGFPENVDGASLTFNVENNAFWFRYSYRDPEDLKAFVESLREEEPPRLCVPFDTDWWAIDGLADVERHPQRVWRRLGDPLDGYVTFDRDTLTVHAFDCGGQPWVWP